MFVRTVYLAGPIRGIHSDDASGWRVEVTKTLESYGFNVLSPLRNTGYSGVVTLDNFAQFYDGIKESEVRGMLVTRDLQDVRRSDLVLAKFDTPGSPRYGTLIEMFFASYCCRIPVIVAVGKDNHDTKSPWVSEFLTVSFETVGEAVEHVVEFWS